MMRARYSIGLSMACWLSITSAYGQWLAPPPKSVTVSDGHGIDVAMKQGKFEQLRELTAQNLAPATHEYAWAAYYRSILDLKDSDTHLNKCLAIGRNLLDRDPVPVLLCGSLLAGNHYIQGDIRGWAMAAADMSYAVTPTIKRITKTSNFVLPGISDIPLEKYFHIPSMLPPPSSSKTFIIPRQGINLEKSASFSEKAKDGVLEDKLPYIIGVQINDAMGPIWFDTGASSTVLGEVTATPSHVKELPSNFIRLNNPFDGQTVQSHLGVAAKLIPGGKDFQDIGFRNVPLIVSSESKVSALGMNLISRLGSMLIENNQIVIHPRLPIDCDQQLHVASEPLGSDVILLNYVINGKNEEIMLDTGDNGYLSASSSASIKGLSQPLSTTRATFQGIENVHYETTEVTLGAGSHALKRMIRYYPDRKAVAPFVMGSAALEDFNVFLDFDHGKACLLPK